MDSKPENDEDESIKDGYALAVVLAICVAVIVYMLYLLRD
jgi:diacylglycerol kinase